MEGSDKRKAKMIFIAAVLGFVALTALNFQYCMALVKYAVGTATIVSSPIPIEIDVNGRHANATLHPLDENIFHSLKDDAASRPCYILLVKDAPEIPPLKIGFDWVGVFSYGGANLVHLGDRIIVSETARHAYDLRDPMKSPGGGYSIESVDGCHIYRIEMKGIPLLRLSLSKGQLVHLRNRSGMKHQDD